MDENETLFKIDSMKKIFKVWRRTFQTNGRGDKVYYGDKLLPGIIRIDEKDVSELYDITQSIALKATERKKENVYICTFETGKGWRPFDVVAQKGREVRFEHINKDVCYVAAYINGDSITPIANPFILNADNTPRFLTPAPETETVILRRKYILVCTFLEEWAYGLNSIFEASNNPKFTNTDTLYTVTKVPIGANNYAVQTTKPYRYVRFKSKHRRFRVAELAFFGTTDTGEEVELTGKMISADIDPELAKKAFDKDYETDIQKDRLNINPTPFWIGLDLGAGNDKKISRIHLTPYSDTNFVEPNHEYELFYYNMGWHSLGKQTADREYLTYDNVPKNALLWLRDLTKGKEERIFTYEHDKQVWW
jgi:hypothetical protein